MTNQSPPVKKSANPKKTSKAEVFIIESLNVDDEDGRREGEVISRTLSMSEKAPIYRYVRTKREFIFFLDEFVRSKYRYLHLSCHGSQEGVKLTLDRISNEEFVQLAGPALRNRRLFLSACASASESLARSLFEKSTCMSVAGPKKKIHFDDAAVFWSAFYHLMFKKDAGRMKQRDIAENMYILSWALAEPFNLHIRGAKGAHRYLSVPSDKILTERLERLLELGSTTA